MMPGTLQSQPVCGGEGAPFLNKFRYRNLNKP